jgi:antitoxin VapB
MAETGIAKLFRDGDSQAVRLPPDFRIEGSHVRVRRVAEGILLEPFIAEIVDVTEWFATMDRLREGYFLDSRSERNQPPTPKWRVISKNLRYR